MSNQFEALKNHHYHKLILKQGRHQLIRQNNKKISRSHGKYKVTTYKWIDYYSNGKKEANLGITVYKNGKRLTNFKAEYYVHYISGGGKWLYTNNHGEKGYKITYVGYNNVLKAYKVTTTVWVKS